MLKLISVNLCNAENRHHVHECILDENDYIKPVYILLKATKIKITSMTNITEPIKPNPCINKRHIDSVSVIHVRIVTLATQLHLYV